MGTITTKYDVGQTVYWASTNSTRKQLPCPDCHGSRSWQAVSPAGRGYSFPCPRCSKNYISDRNLSLEVTVHVPIVCPITIQKIGLDSFDGGVRYMPWKSGGGSVYNERDLFETEDEARAAAEALASVASTEWQARPDVFKGNIEVCDYQIDIAAKTAAERDLRNLQYEINYFIEDLVEMATEASEYEFDKITPVKLVKAIQRRFEKRLPDDLEIDEDGGKVRINECTC